MSLSGPPQFFFCFVYSYFLIFSTFIIWKFKKYKNIEQYAMSLSGPPQGLFFFHVFFDFYYLEVRNIRFSVNIRRFCRF